MRPGAAATSRAWPPRSPDEMMIDTIALAGTPDEVRARFEERWDGVYERPLLWPPASAAPRE